MVYCVVEFSEKCGGGVGIVQDQWLTPRKQECLWPPHKIAAKFNKCLINNETPNETWTVCPIERIFYTTEDLLKARRKLKEAESESEIASDIDSNKRKRKASRKIVESNNNFDSEDDSNSGNEKNVKRMQFPAAPPVTLANAIQRGSSLYSDDTVILEDNLCSADNSTTVLPSGTNDLETGTNLYVNNDGVGSDITSASRSFMNDDLSLSSSRSNYHTEVAPLNISNSPGNHDNGLVVIARHLAKIEKNIEEIKFNQKILLDNSNVQAKANIEPLPAELKLPCDSHDDIKNLEQWLSVSSENEKQLEISLSLVGGKKVQHVVRRLLEKVFTNNLAKDYNWTGKHNKKALRDLKFMAVLPKAVRRNALTKLASDSEIHANIQSWFRNVKDRDGGREKRRINV